MSASPLAATIVPDPTVPPPGLAAAPDEVEISITGRCNLACEYCFYNDEMVALSDLPTERWLALFEELGSLAVRRVTLTGGEVFTRADLWKLIDGLIASRLRYGILSNGTLITEDTVAAFAVGKRRLRLNSIQLSIDGSTAVIHDRSRPPHSFERALRALRLLHEAQMPVTVRVTVNRHNVDDLANIARLLLEDVGLPGFSTNEAEQMGTARCFGQNITLSPKQRCQAMRTLAELNEHYGGRISAAAGPLAMARHFGEITDALARGETGRPGRGTLCSCGGVFNKLAVLHDGTITPCTLLPHLTMGTVGTHRIQDVWRFHPSINAVRMRRSILLTDIPECAGCTYTGFCSGGCPGAVMSRTGRLNTRDTLSCYRAFVGGERDDPFYAPEDGG